MPLSVLLWIAALRANALGPVDISVQDSRPLAPRGIIDLRDSTSRVDVVPFSLMALERDDRDAPSELGFQPARDRFRVPSRKALLGFSDARAVWLSFTVRNVASSRSWLIAAGSNSLDSVSVYIVDPDGSVESLVADSEQRSSEGPHALSEYVFRLTIGPGQIKTIYLRLASEGPLSVAVSLWDSFRYLQADELDSVFVGLLLGVVLAVFFYTFFIAISLREMGYAYYLVYLLGLFCLVLAWGGGEIFFARIVGAWAAQRVIPFFSAVMEFGMAIFSWRYLDIKRRSRHLWWSLVVVAAVAPFFALSLAFFSLRAVFAIGIGLDMIARIVILSAAVYAVLDHGRRRERYFLVSWACVCIGVVVTRLGTLGVLSPSFAFFWTRSEKLGSLAQVLLLSYGITDAINKMRAEKEAGQRRSIELLERANNVKEDFVIRTSLEFRSPLFGIVGLCDALEEEFAANAHAHAEGFRLASLIRAEALRLLGSVASIAAYARLRNNDLALSAERVSLAHIVQDVAGQASHIASGKDIAVETAVEDAEFATDARILGQILYNLFASALKRSSAGVVRLDGGPAGGHVRLAVVDSASSLPEETLTRFLLGGGPGDREAVGPGLELLVARLLAERLGGSLSYSWTDGHGRFELELPEEFPSRPVGRSTDRGGIPAFLQRRATRAGHPAVADLSETSPGRGSRGLILAYDEDPVFLEALKRYLKGKGYAVAPTISADKAVALALADERRFDLILLDASGQGSEGLAACARIRAASGMDELPIVVMTDRESAESVEAAFRAGANDYLPKLSPNELLFARVDTHVALKRAVEDALETRRRISELEKLKTLGVLSAGVAHEVNTPNNAVIRNLPVISEVWRELSPILHRLMNETEGFSIRGWTADELMQEFPELLADTYNAGLQIKKIVEDLKDYARDNSSSPPEPVDISAVAAYASRLLAPLVGRSTRHFALDTPVGLPLVQANFQKLTQVAVGVLENALQSLPGLEAGVRLSTYYDAGGRRLVLECEDEGCGMAPEILAKIFEPFFTTKSDSGGTGLGLSVAFGIVQDAGGEIEIDSMPGKGTTVRVVLPAMSGRKSNDDERRE
jgi:signal transduction histidine kinase